MYRTAKPPQMTNERNLENIFQKDNKKIKSMNKDEIEKDANNWSKKFVIEHKADEYLWLYKIRRNNLLYGLQKLL